MQQFEFLVSIPQIVKVEAATEQEAREAIKQRFNVKPAGWINIEKVYEATLEENLDKDGSN